MIHRNLLCIQSNRKRSYCHSDRCAVVWSGNGFFPLPRQCQVWKVQVEQEEQVGNKVNETSANSKWDIKVSRSLGKADFKKRNRDSRDLPYWIKEDWDKEEDGRSESEKKPQRDLSEFKCYGSGKKGHLKNSSLNQKNLERQKKKRWT